MKIFKFLCYLVGTVLVVSAVTPLLYGVFLIGSVVLFVMALLAFALPNLLQFASRHKIIKRIITCLYTATFLVAIFVFSSMFKQAYFTKPPTDGKITVITLGARVIGDQPSYMLRNRLLVTKEYLDKNPDAVAIMTGGQGADEDYPEGLVMANYLINRGIAPDRILIEDSSTNTLENLKFAQPLIPSDSQGVVIISDDFHQKRASMLADSLGIKGVYALSSVAPYGLIPTYWARDMGGVLYIWLTNLLNIN